MRTRSRLLLSFLGLHLVLALTMGWVAWSWLDASMRAQAQDSARTLGRVIAQGGFPLRCPMSDVPWAKAILEHDTAGYLGPMCTMRNQAPRVIGHRTSDIGHSSVLAYRMF